MAFLSVSLLIFIIESVILVNGNPCWLIFLAADNEVKRLKSKTKLPTPYFENHLNATHQFLFQKYGVNKINKVNNSNLPKSINHINTHFPVIGTSVKLSKGPSCPIEGPTLPNVVATAPAADSKGSSKSNKITAITIDPITKTIKYKIKKTKICVSILGATTFLSIFIRIKALGCSNLLSSINEFLKKTKCLIILIPLLVEPAQAPKNNKIKKNIVSAGFQEV